MRVIIVADRRPISHDPDALYIPIRRNEVWRGPHQAQLFRPARAILGVLAANFGRNFSTDELIEAVWGDDPHGGPESAESQINQAVFALRCVSGITRVSVTGSLRRGYFAQQLLRAAA